MRRALANSNEPTARNNKKEEDDSWTKFLGLQRDFRWDFVWHRSYSSLEEDAGTEVGYCWCVIVVLLLICKVHRSTKLRTTKDEARVDVGRQRCSIVESAAGNSAKKQTEEERNGSVWRWCTWKEALSRHLAIRYHITIWYREMESAFEHAILR
ncbi:hypothetical protein H5410_038968 [Solanum commersonii]|uniref:Uncharacterized protein n=1 Tax=Solanum commersonii TaxID=4109 RepID=A0A9J5YDS2_SOLCO|nr:hypothetical protein H5410_038968 [Solanum commersonii]